MGQFLELAPTPPEPYSSFIMQSQVGAPLNMAAPIHRSRFVDPSITFPTIDPSNQIRLLHLSSSRGHPITCRLSVASIDKAPPYEALSYVWGSVEALKIITVNGHAFRVTQNLFAALSDLVPLDDSVRVLWIDGICINQGIQPEHLAERSQQVQLMCRIFSGASKVIAYLGEPYPWLDQAVEFLAAAATGQQWLVDQLDRTAGFNSVRAGWALISIFKRAWWNRIWTVQEFIVGAQVSFYFGRLGISLDLLHKGVQNIVNLEVWFPSDIFTNTSNLLGTLSTVSAQLSLLMAFDAGKSLLNALGDFQNRNSGDPRDKIYSLIGLFPPSDHIIKVDYTICPEQLFEDFTLAWIQKHNDLRVIGYLHDPEHRVHKNMLSFAIDWSYRPSMDTVNTLSTRILVQKQTFDACKGSKAVWHRRSTGQVCANGFLFDTIKATGVKDISSSWSSRFITLQGIVDMAGVIMGINDEHRQRETLKTIRHTLCMGCKSEAGIFTRLTSQDDEGPLRPWWTYFFEPSVEPSAHRLAVDLAAEEFTVQVASLERTVIFTERGKMGLAPDWCKAGDAIAVMAGGAVPIILRPVGEVQGEGVSSFTVVGEAYVDGYMDGQAFDLCGRGQGSFDEIYLI